MQLGESPHWGDVWARSHEVHAPRYEWPELVKEIARAAGMPEEKIAAWPPPIEEVTLTALCRGACQRERESQRHALLDWFGWDLAEGAPSAEIREAFNARAIQGWDQFREANIDVPTWRLPSLPPIPLGTSGAY